MAFLKSALVQCLGMTSDVSDFQSEPLGARLSKAAFIGVHHSCFGRKPDSTCLLAVDLANPEADITATEREKWSYWFCTWVCLNLVCNVKK